MNRDIIKVLLVDDDEDDYILTRDLVSEIKSKEIDLEWVSTYDTAVEQILNRNHDLYLFDYRLGEHSGLDLLQEAIAKGCKAPIILFTGQGDQELDINALKAGAADYLVKGKIDASVLERSIRYAIERKKAEEQIMHMAYHDSLTNLPNRILFQDHLKQAINHNEGRQKLAAILFLDLDNFKRINDTFGHGTGDKLLKELAERLNSIMRKRDFIAYPTDSHLFARLGGDEFTILLKEIDKVEDVAKVAQRILDTISRPFILDNKEIFITASIGISIYPQDGRDIDSLLKNADAAMYHAKGQGKNNYQYYKLSMNDTALERLTLENDLRMAGERGELLLYYQPQIEIKTGEIVGLEALIRWRHPEKGMIMPSEFIQVAEETGLIIPLGEWVLSNACAQNKAWQDAGISIIPVSVNLSCRQFKQNNLIKTIARLLDEADIKPQYLILEITESAIMENKETVYTTLHELSEMGLRFMIDDFGTGYSSLSYLKRFPIYALKINRSFVKEIDTNHDDEAIVKAIISMAHSLKIKVIAEGVETEQQLKFLIEKECDEVQGYLFSRPLPAEDASKLLTMAKKEEAIVFQSCAGKRGINGYK